MFAFVFLSCQILWCLGGLSMCPFSFSVFFVPRVPARSTLKVQLSREFFLLLSARVAFQEVLFVTRFDFLGTFCGVWGVV